MQGGLLHYPFSSDGLSPEHAGLLASCVDHSVRLLPPATPGSGAREPARRAARLAVAFTRRCGPRRCSAEAVEAAALFMLVLCYLNGAADRPDFSDLVESFQAGLEGRPGRGGLRDAGGALARRLAQSSGGASAAGFRHTLVESLDACVWEARNLGSWPRSLEEYECMRLRTIGALPFLELWKLLEGFAGAPSRPWGVVLAHLERLAARVIFLANDLASEHIDAERGQLNSVALRVHWLGEAHAAARRRVREQHEATVAALVDTVAFLRARQDATRSLRWYLDLVQTCVAGNLLAMRDLAERYAAHPGDIDHEGNRGKARQTRGGSHPRPCGVRDPA